MWDEGLKTGETKIRKGYWVPEQWQQSWQMTKGKEMTASTGTSEPTSSSCAAERAEKPLMAIVLWERRRSRGGATWLINPSSPTAGRGTMGGGQFHKTPYYTSTLQHLKSCLCWLMYSTFFYFYFFHMYFWLDDCPGFCSWGKQESQKRNFNVTLTLGQ